MWFERETKRKTEAILELVQPPFFLGLTENQQEHRCGFCFFGGRGRGETLRKQKQATHVLNLLAPIGKWPAVAFLVVQFLLILFKSATLGGEHFCLKPSAFRGFMYVGVAQN